MHACTHTHTHTQLLALKRALNDWRQKLQEMAVEEEGGEGEGEGGEGWRREEVRERVDAYEREVRVVRQQRNREEGSSYGLLKSIVKSVTCIIASIRTCTCTCVIHLI